MERTEGLEQREHDALHACLHTHACVSLPILPYSNWPSLAYSDNKDMHSQLLSIASLEKRVAYISYRSIGNGVSQLHESLGTLPHYPFILRIPTLPFHWLIREEDVVFYRMDNGYGYTLVKSVSVSSFCFSINFGSVHEYTFEPVKLISSLRNGLVSKLIMICVTIISFFVNLWWLYSVYCKKYKDMQLSQLETSNEYILKFNNYF